jgi:type IV fimbrial biogenesis protein FimT
MNKKQSLGFTLTELMITVAIIGILASIAVPSFMDMIKRARLKTAAESIYADLQYAKMQSVKQNTAIRLIFTKASDTSWCYGVTDQDDCDCNDTSCSIIENGTAILKVTSSSELSDMQLTSAAVTFSFNPIRSTASNSEMILFNGTNYLRVKTSIFGKISYCVPAGDNWGGYYPC